MKECLTKGDILALFEGLMEDLLPRTAEIGELDAVSGDGDLGVTIELGLKKIREEMPKLANEDISGLLIKSGMAFNRAASSTFGTILTTGLMRAGKVVSDRTNLQPQDLVLMLEAAEEGIRQRGKVSEGDKTVLDALVPLRVTLRDELERGETLMGALNKCLSAVRQAVQETKFMQPQKGRSRWLAERSAGNPDPGAVVLQLMLESVVLRLNKLPA